MQRVKASLRDFIITFIIFVGFQWFLYFDSYQVHVKGTPSHLRIHNGSFEKNMSLLRNDRETPENRTVAGIPEEKYNFLVDGKVNCSKPWVSITDDGELGNQICSLYHLYKVKYEYGIQVALTYGVWERLGYIFPFLHIRLLPRRCFHEVKDMEPVHHKEAFKRLAEKGPIENLLIGGAPCSVAKVWFLRQVFIDEFRFAPPMVEAAQKLLISLLARWKLRMKKLGPNYTAESGEPTVVGVHARRADYGYDLENVNEDLFPLEYFRVAFARARQMFGLVAFVVMTDDVDWCRDHLEAEHDDAVVVTNEKKTEVDMALLTLCEHVIASTGTYGTSGALLAGGKLLFPAKNFSEFKKKYGIHAREGIMNQTDIVPVWYNPKRKS